MVASVAPNRFIGIGNPTLGAPPGCRQSDTFAGVYRGRDVDVRSVRSLCSVPETANQLSALASAVGASDVALYLAGRATKPVIMALPLNNYRMIAFATHGLVAGELGTLAEPALVLTPPPIDTLGDDGLLRASDVARLKLDADWVILSGCNTAAGSSPNAEGLSGLARAFFYAGARSLLVSHWPVRSDVAEELTVRMLGMLRRDPTIGRAEALRQAEMVLLDMPDAVMAHPGLWAPFSVVGDGPQGKP